MTIGVKCPKCELIQLPRPACKSCGATLPDSTSPRSPVAMPEEPSITVPGPAKNLPNLPQEPVVEERAGLIGSFISSPNGRYVLGWAEGQFILLEADHVLVRGTMRRPNDGRVADNGTFILSDWMSREALNGTFQAMDHQGKVLVQRRFRANLLNNGISSDGRFAVCQTCHSDNEDGGMLWCFDLLAGKLLWKRSPESNWASWYAFDVHKSLLYLAYHQLGQYAYSLSTGVFLDAERWQANRVQHAGGRELVFIARDRLTACGSRIDEKAGQEILALLDRAFQRGLNQHPQEHAMAYRTMGEVFEAWGNHAKAVANYETALHLNPKVGARRKLNALKKHSR